MPKFVRSSRGEIVDFDLLKLKAEMSSKPAPVEVTERSDFIDNKLKRRIRNIKNKNSIAAQSQPEVKNAIVDVKEEPIVSETPVKTKTPRKIKKSVKTDDKTT